MKRLGSPSSDKSGGENSPAWKRSRKDPSESHEKNKHETDEPTSSLILDYAQPPLDHHGSEIATQAYFEHEPEQEQPEEKKGFYSNYFCTTCLIVFGFQSSERINSANE